MSTMSDIDLQINDLHDAEPDFTESAFTPPGIDGEHHDSLLPVEGESVFEPNPARAEPKITKWTDSGVAERWVESVAGSWCWTAASGFLAWNGHIWAEKADAEALEALRQFCKAEVVRELGGTQFDEVKVAATRLEATKLRAALALAKGQMVVDLAKFDQDPDIAVAPNGVINLITGELMPHDPKRLVTKSCGVDYVPGATHPDWDAVLTSVPPDVDGHLQARFGQALNGHRPDDDVMLALRGGGANAKSTMIDSIDGAFGDYSVVVSDKVLLGDNRDHSTELMDLRGSRWAYIEELPEKRYLNLQRLKKIDGTKKVKARHVHKDNVEFPQTWALTVSSNYDILVDEVDRGTWRRLQEIRYPYTYKKAHEALVDPMDRRGDSRLRDAMLGKEQQQAVLAWLVEGARRWYANDRTMPEPPTQVIADTLQWRKDNDLVLAFVEDHMVVEADAAVLCTDLLGVFTEWLATRGHNKWGMNTLRSRLSENGWLKEVQARLTGRERLDPAMLSRPDDGPGFMQLKRAPSQGQYLIGARFRTRDDDFADIAEMRAAAAPATYPSGPDEPTIGSGSPPGTGGITYRPGKPAATQPAPRDIPVARTQGELDAHLADLEANGASDLELKLVRLAFENRELLNQHHDTTPTAGDDS